MSGVHSKYSGSNAHRFLRCPGQPRLAALVPELPDVDGYAAEGDRAHDWLKSLVQFPGYVDGVAPPHIPQEMHDAIMSVLSFIDKLRAEYLDLEVLSEHEITFPQNVVSSTDATGTADIVAFSRSAQIYWVIDFKYGVGVTVEADDNEQIKFYFAGTIWHTAFKRAYGVIIQPRSFRGGEPRVVEIDAIELVQFVAEVEAGIRRCEDPAAPLIPGDHCQLCPAGGICPARDKQALAIISPDGRPVDALDPLLLPQPVDVSLQRLGDILAMKPQVDKWLKDVEKYAFQMAMAGEHVPGQKIVEAKARRAYANRAGLTDALAAGTGLTSVHFTKPAEIIPMTEAEKLVVKIFKDRGQTAEQAKEWFSQFTTKESSGELSLVPDSDPRPAANRAKNDFVGVVPAQIGEK